MGQLTEVAAIELIGVLSRTEKFPDDEEGKGVLAMARTLMEAAPEEELAARVVDQLRRTCKFCPTDAEIFEAAVGVAGGRADMQTWDPDRKCPLGQCDGSGWLIVESGKGSGATRCQCCATAGAAKGSR